MGGSDPFHGKLAAMTRSIRACLCIALLLPVRSVSAAQSRATTGDLTGVAVDQSKAVLPGAVITATNKDTNLIRSSTTGETGRFSLPALPPGSYTLRAELPGFAPRVLDQVIVTLGSAIDVELMLTLAGTQEAVLVAADSPIVAIGKTAIASVVSQAQIENLPINGRNFISFSIITPGVTTDRTPEQGAAATSGLSFTGQRARSNNIMVDGLDNNDLVVGSVRATFSQEAVREFQVLTNSYSAEFGKASGGIVNIVTKSGTNDFHGNAFFYYRDKGLNAKDHFEKFDVFGTAINRDKSPFSQNQWGATLGGPIRKDHTFFFLSAERVDITANNFVNIDPAAANVLRAAGFPVDLDNVPYDFKTTELLAKLDHQWAPNHSFSLRANFADTTNENLEPFGGIVGQSRGAVQLRTDWAGAAAQTDILSPRWVNEARVQFAHQHQEINSLDPNCGGSCLTDEQGGPTLEVTGVASVGRQRFTPQPRTNDRIQLTKTISFFGGGHAAEAGIDFNYIDYSEQSLPLSFGGRYIFSSLPAIPGLLPTPVSAIQAVALGLPAAYVQGYGHPGTSYPYKDLSLFVQDDWRITRKLTLKPGLRYQRQFWPNFHYAVP